MNWSNSNEQRWSRGHKARGQGQGQGQPFRGQTLSRPRTGMLEAKAKDTKRKCSPKKKKRSSQKFFRRSPKKKRSSQQFFRRSPKKKVFTKIFQAISTKKRFPKNFSSTPQNLTFQKIVLSSSRGQANFRGLEASRPRPRPRTSKSVLEDVLEAKDVLEDSTSCNEFFSGRRNSRVLLPCRSNRISCCQRLTASTAFCRKIRLSRRKLRKLRCQLMLLTFVVL